MRPVRQRSNDQRGQPLRGDRIRTLAHRVRGDQQSRRPERSRRPCRRAHGGLAVLGVLRLQRPDHRRPEGTRPGWRSGQAHDQRQRQCAEACAVVGAHPRAVAGTPLHYGFDRATSTFRLQFTTTRAAGNGVFPAGSITTVSAPQIHYPQGYRATVIGAHVTSAPNAPELRMAADAGADEINVTITPA
ncbi:MAG: hypothetical protein ACXVX9_12515 [Mycobacteriaceae bacterium]